MGALGCRCCIYVAGEGNMKINTVATSLVAGLMGGGVMVLTDNWWYVVAVSVYGLVMNLFGFAEGLKQGRK